MSGLLARIKKRPELQVVCIAVVLGVVARIALSGASSVTLGQVLAGASISGVIALGLTAVIIEGAFDLSVGSTLALGAVIAVDVGNHGVVLGIVAVLALGVAVGLLNGLLVTVLQINSLIATIATLTALQGVGLLVTHSAPVEGTHIQLAIDFITPVFWIITPEMLIFLGSLVFLALFLARTTIGRDFYAVGGNPAAARAAGIRVNRRTLQAFVVCAVFAAIAGWMTATQLNAANPGEQGGGTVALAGITAVVIGGASLRGGAGTAVGTALGAMLLAWIAVVFAAEGLSATYEDVTYGAILLLVVLAGQWSVFYPALLRRIGRLRSPPRLRNTDSA
jgi:ribose transport system permease protein